MNTNGYVVFGESTSGTDVLGITRHTGADDYGVGGVASGTTKGVGAYKPNVKVTWQVTGIRQDPHASEHHIPVEESKPQKEGGLYLHPDAYGQPESKGIGYEEQQKLNQGNR